MKTKGLTVSVVLLAAHLAAADETKYPPAKVSYDAFKSLVAEVEPHRQERLVDLNAFLKMSQEPGIVVLDTRSAFRYERIHLKGARHLSFPDFTQENLRKVIPTPETKVLIYCNNNFDGNQVDFASKLGMPGRRAVLKQPGGEEGKKAPATPQAQFGSQEKPLMLALNVPTYITLYGYGYRNVYELDELVKVTDPRVTFEGSIVAPNKP